MERKVLRRLVLGERWAVERIQVSESNREQTKLETQTHSCIFPSWICSICGDLRWRERFDRVVVDLARRLRRCESSLSTISTLLPIPHRIDSSQEPSLRCLWLIPSIDPVHSVGRYRWRWRTRSIAQMSIVRLMLRIC